MNSLKVDYRREVVKMKSRRGWSAMRGHLYPDFQ